MSNPYYREYSDFLRGHFHGKVQKISVNTRAICPNRDGTLGTGGCAYCNVSAFTPGYALAEEAIDTDGVRAMLEEGKRFFSRKYPEMRYLAYFQSYTTTHGNVDKVMAQFEAAAAVDGVVGIVIGTRPDCMPDGMLARLAALAERLPVFIEYGAETSHDRTLRAVNRCHAWADTVDAVRRTHAAGLSVGLHLILGLPGESRADMLETVRRVNDLPVDVVKFHQLQIVRGTALARRWQADPASVPVFDLDEYLNLCTDIVDALRSDIAIDRFVSQSPADMLLAPRWALKNYEFTARLHRLLAARATSRPHDHQSIQSN